MDGWLVLAAGLTVGLAAVRWWVPRVVAREMARRDDPAGEREALLAVLDEYTALWTEDNQKLLRAWRDERRALEQAVQDLQRRVAELEGRLEAMAAYIREEAAHARGTRFSTGPSVPEDGDPAQNDAPATAVVEAGVIGANYRAVLELAQEGLSAAEIARRLDIGTGEVELVLTLSEEARRWRKPVAEDTDET